MYKMCSVHQKLQKQNPCEESGFEKKKLPKRYLTNFCFS